MEVTVKQRLVQFIKFMHLTQKAFEERCGMGNGYVNSIRRSIGPEKMQDIIRAFPELNREWLLYGEGEMLRPSAQVVQNNVLGNNNINSGVQGVCPECGRSDDIEIIESEEVRRPIIPTEWTYRTDIDIYEKVQRDKKDVSLSRFIALDVPIDMWHIVRDDSLLPDCKRGDLLALKAYPIGQENPIPGKIHAVDTKSNGMIVRILEHAKYGYRATAPNSVKYPEMRITKEDIIRVYRIVCLARIAI